MAQFFFFIFSFLKLVHIEKKVTYPTIHKIPLSNISFFSLKTIINCKGFTKRLLQIDINEQYLYQKLTKSFLRTLEDKKFCLEVITTSIYIYIYNGVIWTIRTSPNFRYRLFVVAGTIFIKKLYKMSYRTISSK